MDVKLFSFTLFHKKHTRALGSDFSANKKTFPRILQFKKVNGYNFALAGTNFEKA
jgi:hypothetical protein